MSDTDVTTTATPSPAAGERRSLPQVLSKAPPVAMVIFGASGDLTARKILPALARLADRGVLDDGFTIIGVARTEWSDEEFRSHVTEATPEGGPKWRALTERFKYIAGEYDHPVTFQHLKSHLDEADRVDGTAGNRLYYLATIPSVFGLVAGALAAHACVGPDTDERFMRVVVEKPYGRDLDSAIALDEKMHAAFDESQIYRIDHYMGKETVQNVLALRFANAIFEPIWNRRYVEQVQVTVAESIGVEHRGGFYETAGALRDIVQNHVMQVLALTLMESPTSTDADRIRDEKVKLLQAIYIPTPDEAVDKAVRAQYGPGVINGEKVLGYRQEQDVSPESMTETYLALRLRVENWRWSGVPVYVRTGKRLPARVTEVVLAFRQVPFLLFDHRTSRDLRPNALILRIQPNEGISLEFGAKIPGEKFHLRSVAMDFNYAEAFAGEEAADGYERLIHDAMVGDATLFIRSDEVQQAWRIVDPYLQVWSEPDGAMLTYPAGTWGPHMADLLVERSGDAWRNPVIDLELSGGRVAELPSERTRRVNGTVQLVPSVAAAFARLVAEAVSQPRPDRFSMFLSGGPTAEACYRRLAQVGGPGSGLPWGDVDVYLDDERCVPPDHADSNHRMITEALLQVVGPVGSDHPAYRSGTPSAAAADYQAVIAPLPAFDLVHLGLGPDGHTASLFPGSAALDIVDPGVLVVANRDPTDRNPYDRITLTYPGIARARLAVFTVSGASKREAFAAVVAGDDLPATRVTADRILWLVDSDAAGDTPFPRSTDRGHGWPSATGMARDCRSWDPTGRVARRPVARRDRSDKVSPMPADPGSTPLYPSAPYRPEWTDDSPATPGGWSVAELIGAPVATLQESAGRIRRAAHGNRITFSPKVFIPLTMLCRDRCGYCTFAKAPARVASPYLSIDQVLDIARAGLAAGCHEALFTLGEGPEDRYPAAQEWLHDHGYASTVDYLVAACRAVVEETGLLPHANAGALHLADLLRLRPVSASQGMMVESVNPDLAAHRGAPDKVPARRLATLEAAGQAGIPFTTGLLVGIGESRADRVATLEAIAASHRRHGHVQEVIVQNFLPKPGTAMHRWPPCPTDEFLWTIAAARVVLPVEIHLQAPPNLSDDLAPLMMAGIDDWGGVSPVTADHVNPERAWPDLDILRAATEAAGFTLAPRLTLYPGFALDPDRWLDEAMRFPVLDASDAEGLGRDHPWSSGGEVLPPALLGGPVPGPEAPATPTTPPVVTLATSGGAVAEVLSGVLQGETVGEDEIVTLFSARGSEVRAVAAVADQLRFEAVGDEVTYVNNRNINYTNVCTFKCKFCAFSKGPLSLNLRGTPYLLELSEISDRVREAEALGATEVCLQGGIHPSFDGEYYLEVIKAVREASDTIHIHGFTALEVTEGARRSEMPLADYLVLLRDAGLKTLPGTAAEILDDPVRAILCPDKINTEEWLFAHRTAHGVGLRSNVTIMFGAVEQPRSWARHLVATRELQGQTGGFTEFVPLPFVHMATPLYLQKRSRRGPTFRETLLMHAVGRIAYRGSIDNIQISWVKMGAEGVRQILRAGVNDLGGTLMDENISRAAGASHGQMMDAERFAAIVEPLGRSLAQRTTLYGRVDGPRTEALAAAT